VEACVVSGRREVLPVHGVNYYGFTDPSGGSQDSMTLAIGHRKEEACVLDAVRERKPPFSPEAVVKEFSDLLKRYQVSQVSGDRYAGEWPREQFRRCGIEYKTVGKVKSQLYRDLLPVINSSQIELLDHPRLLAQLVGLERRPSHRGRDSIDHGPSGHDDLANCLAGVVTLIEEPRLRWLLV